jgi:aromatic-L-amino-acid/L-tryptophan decarboxylase
MGRKGIRWIEQDDRGKIRIDVLEQAIQADIGNGALPFMVVGNAGDVSTGVVDDLESIGAICKKYKLWFHVDGAYGMPAAILPRFKSMFAGVRDADSIAIDPHKWLYAPLEVGCTLVKDPNTLLNTYSSHPSYYNFSDAELQPHNYYEYGFQNSRGFRALKVWVALQQVGRSGYTKMIEQDIKLAELFFRLAGNHPELEAVSQNLSITTLRYIPTALRDKGEEKEEYLNTLNTKLLNTLQRNGQVFLSNAIVKEKYCLRGCIVNFRTTEKDIEEIIEIVVTEGRKIHLDGDG